MSEVLENIEKISARILQLTSIRDAALAERNRCEVAYKSIRREMNEEWDRREAEARDNEAQSRTADANYQAAKREIEQLTAVLNNQRVAANVANAQAEAEKLKAEAAKSKEEVDSLLARLAEKEKQLDAKLAE